MMNFKSGEIEGIVEIIQNKLKITVEEREKNV